MSRKNFLLVSRHVHGHVVQVVSEMIDRVDLYGVICRIDGVLFDLRLTGDAWSTSEEMLAGAISYLLDGDGKKNGGDNVVVLA